jgi:hypothetical protein
MSFNNNSSLLNLLVVLTIIIGLAVTILILDKEQYFPDLYAKHGAPAHVEEDSISHDETLAEDTSAHITASATNEQEVIDATPLTLPRPEPQAGEYVLVAGSFLKEDYALKFQSGLQEKVPGIRPEVIPFTQQTTTYYRVVALRVPSWSEILTAKRTVEEAGYSQTWIFRQ